MKSYSGFWDGAIFGLMAASVAWATGLAAWYLDWVGWILASLMALALVCELLLRVLFGLRELRRLWREGAWREIGGLIQLTVIYLCSLTVLVIMSVMVYHGCQDYGEWLVPAWLVITFVSWRAGRSGMIVVDDTQAIDKLEPSDDGEVNQ